MEERQAGAAAAAAEEEAVAPEAEPTAEEGEEGGDIDASAATGVARTSVVGTLRTGYLFVLRTFGRWAASPHKLFRPENPSVLRFEDALDAVRWASEGRETAAGNSRGLYSLVRNHGPRQAFMLKCRSVAVNSAMGTVLFGTYDLVRSTAPRGEQPSLGRTAAAAAIAGSVHGAMCAPLEVAAMRLQAAGVSQGPLTPGIWAALRQPLPISARPGLRPRMLSGSLVPLGIVRDGLGISAFFLTFEVAQVKLQTSFIKMLDSWNQERGDAGLPPVGAGLAPSARAAGTLLAGGSAGVAYRVVSWPYDALLVRATAKCEVGGPLPALGVEFREMLREVGARQALLPPARAVASAFPASALGLLVYEWLR